MGIRRRIGKPPDTYTGSQIEWDALSGDKQYYIVNKVKYATMKRIWNAKNHEKRAAYNRWYRSKNKELVSACTRKWRTENKERSKSVQKVWDGNNTQKKKDINTKSKKKQRIENKAGIAANDKKYRDKNGGKINTKQRARTVKKREALYESIAVAIATSNKEIAERA